MITVKVWGVAFVWLLGSCRKMEITHYERYKNNKKQKKHVGVLQSLNLSCSRNPQVENKSHMCLSSLHYGSFFLTQSEWERSLSPAFPVRPKAMTGLWSPHAHLAQLSACFSSFISPQSSTLYHIFLLACSLPALSLVLNQFYFLSSVRFREARWGWVRESQCSVFLCPHWFLHTL